MIFSSSATFSSPPDPHQAHFLSNSQSHTQWANLSKQGPFLDDAMVAAQSPQHSKYAHIDNAVSSLYQEDQDVDEVQCVTHRYEDTNRLLRSLFLSRRRRLDISQDPGSSA
ncbi:hypothetical protein A0H81_00547 [Grifola frondosa]|uniref:Uncharacterized protein n=1 Tax=Grifola frondosa TaxID=5627 RepID=A0A1C7MRX6_GRIFR|nr:hypothetical protein A0H81_00547 [Grifola frondosa]